MRLTLRTFRELYFEHGGIAYDPKRLLGVLLLAYTLGGYSSRKMEELCRYDIRFMHVADSQTPDYRTFARFRRRIEPVLEGIFSRILSVCSQEGLTPLRLGALDGTKLAANTYQLRRFLSKDDDDKASDDEARLMKGHHGYLRGYNLQAMVDADTGVILGTDTSKDPGDFHRLSPLMQNVTDSVGQLPETIVADGGYESSDNLAAAEAAGTNALIAPRDDSALFWTAVSETEVVCPMGHPLVFRERRPDHRGVVSERFHIKQCPSCVFRSSCCGPMGRTLRVTAGLSPTLRVLKSHHCRSPEGKQAMKARRTTIEPLWGNLKYNKHFTRFLLRGLRGARIEFLLLAICINLSKLRSAVFEAFFALFARFLISKPITTPS